MKLLLFLGIASAAFHISHSNIPDLCQLPEDQGVGSSFIFSLYYDASHDQCSPFIFKGQGGNANRFQSEIECMRNCSAKANNIYPMEASKICILPKAVGDCSVQIVSYYYDAVHHKCKRFLWSGCHGNGNRFSNSSICNSTCAGIHHDDEFTSEEEESDTPIAIICGVLLAVIIVAFLITVIVLTVQSKKKSTKKKAAEKSKDPQSNAPLQEEGIELA